MKDGRGWLKGIVPVVSGMMAGAVASIVVPRMMNDAVGSKEPGVRVVDTQLIATNPMATLMPVDSSLGVKRDQRITELEQRLAQLEAPKESESPTREHAGEDGVSAEQQRAELEVSYRQALEAHSREPVDVGWARSTEDGFAADFRDLTGHEEWTVLGVQCRSSTCSASFEWKNYDTARAAYSSILHKSYKANCVRSILLPEPEDPNRPYRATALYDCSAWKAGIVN